MKKRIFGIFCLLVAALFFVQPAAAQTENPQAVCDLLNRIGGSGTADRFVTIVDESLSTAGNDVFVITSSGGKPCIKGNTTLAVTTGINWYLNHYAHVNLAWNNLTTDLSGVTLPVPSADETHNCAAVYRYYLNYCTFSYSMAFWTWERWQQEIDWMALHGINMPLQIVGLEVLWRNVLSDSRIGYSDSEIADFIAGPGFMAWFAMNNLEGWGGTVSATDVSMSGNPDWWYTRQEELCKKILAAMRAYGMQPVLPGYCGMVPNSMGGKTISGINTAHIINSGTWAGGYTRPDILNPSSTSFDYMAEIYYEKLEELMGVSEYYSMDPFHEGGVPTSVVSLSDCYNGVMEAMDTYFATVTADEKTASGVAADKAKWVVQYWQGLPAAEAFNIMDDNYADRFIALDLFSDAQGKAKWNTSYFYNCDFIFCMLHNFGGRSGLHGRITTLISDYFDAVAADNKMMGVGATPEGIETNPILYDMLFELPWIATEPTAEDWLKEYSYARYGVDPAVNSAAYDALVNLKNSVWACTSDQQGTSEAVVLARPAWTVDRVSSWSTAAIYWDIQDVLLAADQLLSVSELVPESSKANYQYDVVDVVRQTMVDYAYYLLPEVKAAYDSGDTAEYERLYKLFLSLIEDLDTMLATDENFTLERWTSMARNTADEVSGTGTNDKNWMEWNARTQITVWSKTNSDLHDYSNRCWSGLLKDFHYKRWKDFFEHNGSAPSGGWFSGFEYPWTVNFTDYDYSTVNIDENADAVSAAQNTFGKYFYTVEGADGSKFFFPTGVERTASADIVCEAYRGKTYTLPLTVPDGVSVAQLWIDLNADLAVTADEYLTVGSDLTVTIPEDAAIGKCKAIATFDNSTQITFSVAILEEITTARTVTVAVSDACSGWGTVSISGSDALSVTNTASVEIQATAAVGYNFHRWVDSDGNVVSSENPYTYYAKEAAAFEAVFVEDIWGVPSEDKTDINDISGYAQYVNEITFALYQRDAQTIYSASECPSSLFNVVPTAIDVAAGASFDISWSDPDGNGLQYCNLSAYIDLNADGDFDDEGELLTVLGTKGATNSAVCEGTVNVLLPYDAPIGLTHMRLRFDGAWKGGYDAATGAYPAKGTLNRMCYEIIVNITKYPNTASEVSVQSENETLGTVSVATNETPSDTKLTQTTVSRGILMTLTAEPADNTVVFRGWYDRYGRLVSTDAVCTMYAPEDAVYTAKFSAIAVLLAEAEQLLNDNENNHADTPALGQYPSSLYNALQAEVNNAGATEESLQAAIDAFKAGCNWPVFRIRSNYSKGDNGVKKDAFLYSTADENSRWNYASALKTFDRTAMWVLQITSNTVTAAESIPVSNCGTGFGIKIDGTEATDIKTVQIAADNADIFYIYSTDKNTTMQPWNHPTIGNWDNKDIDGPSAWYFEYVCDTYSLTQMQEQLDALESLQTVYDTYKDYKFGDAPGYYTGDADALATALSTAATLLAKSISDIAALEVATIEAASAAITNVINSATLNKPAEGSYLRIGYNFGDAGVKYMQGTASGVTGKENSLLMTADTGAESVFYYDGKTLLSYSKGLYFKETNAIRGLQDIGTAGGTTLFRAGASVGLLKIIVSRYYLHANSSGSVYFIDHCSSDNGDTEHNFTVEVVSSLPVTIDTDRYATLYAPTALEIPTGVTAYTGSLSGNTLSLTAIDGGVIPANTGVILVADAAGTYNFPVSADAPAAIENNSLGGSACTILATDVSRPYTLQQHDGTVAMYEYIGANLQGFKAYLSLDATAADAAGAIALRFPDATAIQGVNSAAAPSVLYDLTGRRVDSATATGIYIVDGKKVIIK